MPWKPKNKKPKTKSFEKKVERTIIRKIGQEHKVYDFSVATGSIGTAGTVQNLADLAPSADQGGLVGCKIRVRSLYFAYSAQMASVSNTTLRFVIVQDRSGSATPPTATDILPATGSVFAPLMPKNAYNLGRFTVLWDNLIVGDANNLTKAFHKWIKVKIPNVYYGNNGIPNRNCIYLLMISSASANLPAVQIYSRMTYTDS